MTERKKLSNLLSGKDQIADGSIDELLLDDELRAKIAMIEKLEARLTTLEKSIGRIDGGNFTDTFDTASS